MSTTGRATQSVRNSLKTACPLPRNPGTEGSNPPPSSGESSANFNACSLAAVDIVGPGGWRIIHYRDVLRNGIGPAVRHGPCLTQPRRAPRVARQPLVRGEMPTGGMI